MGFLPLSLLPLLELDTDEESLCSTMSGAGLLMTGGDDADADAEDPGGSGAGGGIISVISLTLLSSVVSVFSTSLAAAAF